MVPKLNSGVGGWGGGMRENSDQKNCLWTWAKTHIKAL